MRRQDRKAQLRANAEKSPTITPGAKQSALPVPTPMQVPAALAQHIGEMLTNSTDRGGFTQYTIARKELPPNNIADVGSRNIYSPLQPIQPYGPSSGITYPREWDYVTGYNIDIVPARFGVLEMLRLMSQSWGILRAVIETRKDQMLRQPWTIRLRDDPKKQNKRLEELKTFFRKPDGKNRWDRWCRLLLEDMLVIDAATLYTGWRRADGKPYAVEVIDGATIKPLIDDAGRRPDYPSPAFQQLIKGLPMINFDETEIIYAPMRPRPQMPIYGYPPTEQIVTEIVQGIQRASYQANFWREGTMPELIMSVPADWNAQQIGAFQAMFDALMSGNVGTKSRIRFVPDGMKPFDIKNANGEGLKADIDEWLARIACYAYSVPPTPFIRQMNRATADNAQEEAQEEGLHPLMTWFKTEIMDPLIQEPEYGFGYDDCEFDFTQEREVDELKQMQVLTGYVKEGIWKRNEARDVLSLEPAEGGDDLTVDTVNGPVPVAETVEANRQKALSVPDQLNNQQESHDVQIANQKQPSPQPKPGVGKFAGAPFHEGARSGRASAEHDAGCYCNHCLTLGKGAYAAAQTRRRKAQGYLESRA